MELDKALFGWNSVNLERAEQPGTDQVQEHSPIHDQAFEGVSGHPSMGATDHTSQGVHHTNLLEATEDTNQIEEASAAASPHITAQEELAASLEHPDKQ